MKKIKVLKNDEPLTVKRATLRVRYAWSNKKYYNREKICTYVYTDGEIVDSEVVCVENTSKFVFSNGKAYDQRIDKVMTKNLYLKDYTYAITYVIAEEYMQVGKVVGFFKVVKDTGVYFKDKVNWKAIRAVCNAITDISEQNTGGNYNSILDVALGKQKKSRRFKEEVLEDKVYRLVKTR